MSEPDAQQDPQPDQHPEPESDWERKARLARIFGDVLPASTSDDRDEPSAHESGSDAWLKAQVPPHHGS